MSQNKFGAAAYQSINAEGSIESADQHKLVEMLYSGAITKINQARSHMEMNNTLNKGKTIGEAISIIEELRRTLNMEEGGELAVNLHDLYEYMKTRLLQANLKNDSEMLDEVKRLISTLLDGWNNIPESTRKEFSA
ncbi:MAG TPA: flagellar export chaperone FliS [Gammaproteobacteria bacterium]|nr:flagellar export chaperone FliS [Gammaproteobacteria bacterium]